MFSGKRFFQSESSTQRPGTHTTPACISPWITIPNTTTTSRVNFSTSKTSSWLGAIVMMSTGSRTLLLGRVDRCKNRFTRTNSPHTGVFFVCFDGFSLRKRYAHAPHTACSFGFNGRTNRTCHLHLPLRSCVAGLEIRNKYWWFLIPK